MKIKKFFLFFSAFVITLSLTSVHADKIDEYILSEMQKKKIPAMSIAIVKDGEIVKAKGYGLANVELDVPAKPDTIYQSGSIGKQFTATLIMMLVEEKKISLDEKISKYLKGSPQHWKNITIRHLLTHTSGIKNYTLNEKNHNSSNINFRLDYSDDQLVKMAESMPLDFQPGEKWSYSNTGYVLLGIIIKNITGKFWGDLAKELIFEPLDMKTARVISEADIIQNRAAGYHLVNGELKNQEYVSPSLNRTADGALYLTVLDLAKWDKALYSETLLKKSTLDQMWTPVKLNNGETYPYGFGWKFEEVNKHRNICHGGFWQGFGSKIDRFADDKLTVIVLTNLGAKIGPISSGIAGLYNPALVSAGTND